MVATIEPITIQRAVQKAGTLIDEAVRNRSIKKNPKKKGNGREPNRDRNARDENKMTRTGNAFAITTNLVKREYNITIPKCVSCNLHHPPEMPCRACFNCGRPGHMEKDCRVAPRIVNPVNVRNPTTAPEACYECGGTDHFKASCPRLEGKRRHLMSTKAKEQKREEIVVVRDFPKTREEHEAHLGLVLELLKELKLYASDHNCKIRYHSSNANVVADALSRKEIMKPKRIRSINMTLHSNIKGKILTAQEEASDEPAEMQRVMDEPMEHRSDGALYYLDRIWVHLKGDMITLIMDEAYKSNYSIHPGADKMHYDLRDRKIIVTALRFSRDDVMMKNILDNELATNVDIILSDVGVGLKPKVLSFTRGGRGKIVRTCLTESDFGVVRFGKKGKQEYRFVRPFEIIESVGLITYRLRLPEELNGVYDTFHMLTLKKCLADPTQQIPLDEILVDAKLNFVEEPVEILEREFKKLKRSRIAIVNV
nr:putative reverse transcriptase domain-containing protein [Tanacetum cinerariifolium]